MKLKLIVNPAAGRKKANKAIPAIRQILTEKNLDFHIDITSHPGEATYLSQKASKNNFRIIIAAGGDGTVHEVVNGMIDSGCTLGVIPLGLGNDFAKGIGITFRLQEACLAISEGILALIFNGYFERQKGFCRGLAWQKSITLLRKELSGPASHLCQNLQNQPNNALSTQGYPLTQSPPPFIYSSILVFSEY